MEKKNFLPFLNLFLTEKQKTNYIFPSLASV